MPTGEVYYYRSTRRQENRVLVCISPVFWLLYHTRNTFYLRFPLCIIRKFVLFPIVLWIRQHTCARVVNHRNDKDALNSQSFAARIRKTPWKLSNKCNYTISWSNFRYYLKKITNGFLKDVFCHKVDRHCGVVKPLRRSTPFVSR